MACAALCAALADDAPIPHWSGGDDTENGESLVLLRAAPDALHCSLLWRPAGDGGAGPGAFYAAAALDDAAVDALRVRVGLDYDGDDDAFAEDLAAALRSPPTAHATDGGPRLTLHFAPEGMRPVRADVALGERAALPRALLGDLAAHFRPRPEAAPEAAAPPAAAPGAGFQTTNRPVVRNPKKRPRGR